MIATREGEREGGWGVLPYMGYIGMCGPKGYGFSAVLLIKKYTFSATGEIRLIHDHIDCNSTNLIYMIHCLRYNKQYIGETKRRLKDRFNEHR